MCGEEVGESEQHRHLAQRIGGAIGPCELAARDAQYISRTIVTCGDKFS